MKIKIWIGIAISALFIWLTFKEVDYSSLWMAMKKADYNYLLPVVIVTMLQFYIRALRWGTLMEPIKKIGQLNLFSATSIGYMANNILPARIGEVVKAYAIGRSEDVSMSASFATIVIERLIDLMAVLMLLFLVLFIVDFPADRSGLEQVLRKGGLAAIPLFLFVVIFMHYFKKNSDLFKRITIKLISPVSNNLAEKAGRFLDSFASGLAVMKRGHHLVKISLYSVIIWFIAAIPIHLTLVSFGHRPPFSISLFILVLIGIAVSIPSAPGFIGTFHFACSKGLELFNLPVEEALSISIILHAINFFPITIIGFFFLWRNNISLMDAEKLEESEEALP